MILLNRLVPLFVVLVLSGSALASKYSTDTVVNASVLIRTNLKHGFSEDDDASGRWRGSGFVINKEKGWIMTNGHVSASGPAEIRVQFVGDKSRYEASRLFVDSRHDVAILQVDPAIIPEDVTELSLDCEYTLKRGDRVVSVGHPTGHEFTLSLGVMSGTRTFGADTDLYSTDVIVESGSSGSPVVSLDSGLVVGVSTARYDDSDVGLLTTARDACQISRLIEAGIDPSRPRLDFQLLLIEKESSNVVGQIFGSESQLRVGDQILEIEGKPWDPKTLGEFEDNLRIFETDEIEITVKRQGSRMQLRIPNNKIGSLHERDWLHFSGLTFTEAKHQDSRYRNAGRNHSIIRLQTVDDTHDDTTELGFDEYAVLLSVDGREFDDLKQLYDYLKSREGEPISLIARDYDMTHEWVAYPFQHEIRVEDLASSFEIDQPESR